MGQVSMVKLKRQTQTRLGEKQIESGLDQSWTLNTLALTLETTVPGILGRALLPTPACFRLQFPYSHGI